MMHHAYSRPASKTDAEILEMLAEIEARTGLKHEYVLGRVYALAGATEDHNRLSANIIAALLPAARVAHCRVVGSDQRLRPADSPVYYYPDVQVLCDPTDNDPLVKHRPMIIVEVTSTSTESTDHREKLLVYRGIESLQLYLVVAQDRREVLVYARDDNPQWQSYIARDGDEIDIARWETTLPLDSIYADIID